MPLNKSHGIDKIVLISEILNNIPDSFLSIWQRYSVIIATPMHFSQFYWVKSIIRWVLKVCKFQMLFFGSIPIIMTKINSKASKTFFGNTSFQPNIVKSINDSFFNFQWLAKLLHIIHIHIIFLFWRATAKLRGYIKLKFT